MTHWSNIHMTRPFLLCQWFGDLWTNYQGPSSQTNPTNSLFGTTIIHLLASSHRVYIYIYIYTNKWLFKTSFSILNLHLFVKLFIYNIIQIYHELCMFNNQFEILKRVSLKILNSIFYNVNFNKLIWLLQKRYLRHKLR